MRAGKVSLDSITESGYEPGANDLWVPGGKLPNGNSGAVLDLGNISTDKYGNLLGSCTAQQNMMSR